jgi:hypothetical protein
MEVATAAVWRGGGPVAVTDAVGSSDIRAFVSYARADAPAARRLAIDVGRLVDRCWIDVDRIYGGQRWWDEILREIAESTFVVLALTPNSLSSIWCRREWEWARSCQRPIVPIQIASATKQTQPLPAWIREHQIVAYAPRSAEAVLSIAEAVRNLSRRPTELPTQLPDPPALPEQIEDDVEREAQRVSVAVEWASSVELAELNVPVGERRWAVRVYNASTFPLFDVEVTVESNNGGVGLEVQWGTVAPHDLRGVPYILNEELREFDPFGEPPRWSLTFTIAGVACAIDGDGSVHRGPH